MIPRLGDKHNLKIGIISKARDTYRSIEHLTTGLPPAPALMLADEILVQGRPISKESLESAMHHHLAYNMGDKS
jgi:hypothetical protein